jgi:hypothetical protein
MIRVAFDLDDTLIPCRYSFPVERPRRFLARLLADEHLREGSYRLLKALRRMGCELAVYTTSLRSPLYIKSLFFLYGFNVRGVINQETHMKWVERQYQRFRSCSKYPPAFGIDLLVDDSEGVQLEARQYNYNMVLVRPDDHAWADAVLSAVDRLRAGRA